MVRQLRVAHGRVMTYRFLTGEGSTALVKNGQGRAGQDIAEQYSELHETPRTLISHQPN